MICGSSACEEKFMSATVKEFMHATYIGIANRCAVAAGRAIAVQY